MTAIGRRKQSDSGRISGRAESCGTKAIGLRKHHNLLRRYGLLYVMMIPALVYLFINNYLPMAGLVIAFKDVNFAVGLFRSKWIGLKNFEYLFATQDAWVITKNTILYNLVFISFNVLTAVIVAILLSELTARRMKKFYQSSILFPYLISMIIISYLGNAFLSTDTGFINTRILHLFGAEPVSWYMEPKVWPFILVFVNAWKNVGYLCIIFLGAILGISREYYEAAAIEGATKLQQIRHIMLPMISSVIIMMVMIFVGRIFYSDFGLFYHVPMNSGSLYSTTNVIETYVYRGLMQLGDIGMSSAAGLYQSVVGFIVVLLANFAVRKVSPDNAMF